ncbi:MAG: hypothetical protein IJ759_07570 [Bacteroidales bacterium]|nr:hypothetical protein [Bacteroidales bacterium]
MKKITIGITLSKEFESCQQWSQNRAWQKDNPNKSRDNLNFTYAMSEDDEMFFEEYSETVVAEVAVDDLFKLFKRYTRKCFTEDYEFDYNQDFAKFNYVVTNNFSAKALHTLLFQYIKYRILYHWYWEKNMYEDLQYVELELDKLAEKIRTMAINEAQADDEDIDGEPMDIIPYNDGFVINPPRKRRTIPTEEDETETIGVPVKAEAVEVTSSVQVYVGQTILISSLYSLKPSGATPIEVNTRILMYYNNDWVDISPLLNPFEIKGDKLTGHSALSSGRFAVEISNKEDSTMSGICEVEVLPDTLTITKDLGE